MNATSSARQLSRLWLLLVTIVAIAVLYLAKVLFLPLAFAILFGFLLAPAVSLLERWKFPRALAGLIVLLGFVALLVGAGSIFFTQLIGVANDLPTYRDNITQKLAAIHRPSDSAFSRAQHELERLSEEIGIANSTAAPASLKPGVKASKPLGTPERPIQVRDVSHSSMRLDELGGILEPLTTAFLTIVFTFFVILQREDLRNRLIRLSGDRNLTVMTQAMDDASRRISRYFGLQLLVNFIYGTIICIALYAIGLPHALLFGALAGILRFLPYIGAPVAAIIPTVLSLAVFQGWSKGLLIAGVFFVMEVVTANYAEPHIYGKHTGLSSLAILVAAGFWTLIWGPVGLLLSVPLTVCLVVIGRHVPSLEFVTVMLGDKPAIPPWTCLYQRLLARDEREPVEILERALESAPLPEVFESVLIPALLMSESDRIDGNLDESTLRFVRHAVRDLIEEAEFREPDSATPEGATAPLAKPKVVCVPVRDDADELAAMMLAECLNDEQIHSFALPVQRFDQQLSSIVGEKADIVALCGLPPVGMARVSRLYRALHLRSPELKVLIGIWNSEDDASELARRVGEDTPVLTHITEAVQQVREQLGVRPAVAMPEELPRESAA